MVSRLVRHIASASDPRRRAGEVRSTPTTLSSEYQQAVVLLALWLALVLPFASQCGAPSMLGATANAALDRTPSTSTKGASAVRGDACNYDAAVAAATVIAGDTMEEGEDYADGFGTLLCWVKAGIGSDGALEGFLGATTTFTDYAVPTALVLTPGSGETALPSATQRAPRQHFPDPDRPPPRLL